MNIKEKFESLNKKNEKALIIYLTGGFPTINESIEFIKKIADCGADIIEIGIPFSDPIADGKVIQQSSNIAISKGATLGKILDSLEDIRINVPLVIMSYINPLIAYGKEKLFKRLKEVNISGIIIPDLPFEESREWKKLSRREEIDLIYLLSPTTSEDRMIKIVESSEGFIYCVSDKGITGERKKLPKEIVNYLSKVKKFAKTPVVVGFGISNENQITMLKDKVDGIVIGSRIIKGIIDGENIIDLIKKFKEKLRC